MGLEREARKGGEDKSKSKQESHTKRCSNLREEQQSMEEAKSRGGGGGCVLSKSWSVGRDRVYRRSVRHSHPPFSISQPNPTQAWLERRGPAWFNPCDIAIDALWFFSLSSSSLIIVVMPLPGLVPRSQSQVSTMTHGGSYQVTISHLNQIAQDAIPSGSDSPNPARAPRYTLDQPSHGRPHIGAPITVARFIAMTLRFLYAPRSRPRFLSFGLVCASGTSTRSQRIVV